MLLWVAGDSETVYLESLDGEHFGIVAGPGGGLEPVDNGYASLGAPPRLSTDGRNWKRRPSPPPSCPTEFPRRNPGTAVAGRGS